MFELLAIAPEDGWAFLRRHGALHLLRPPYQSWNLETVAEESLERALHQHGFIVDRRVFADWASLIAELKARTIAAYHAQGRQTADSETIRSLLHKAPRPVLQTFLDRVEHELLPNRERRAAFEILTELLGVRVLRDDTELYERTVELLRQGRADADDENVRRSELTDEAQALAEHFPLAAARYGADDLLGYARGVWERQQILAFGG